MVTPDTLISTKFKFYSICTGQNFSYTRDLENHSFFYVSYILQIYN